MASPSTSIARGGAARAAPPPWRRAALATLGVAAIVAAGFAALPSADVWSRLTPGDCAEYCEAHTRCGAPSARAAIQQPLNAWSNAAFLFVGLLAWRRPLAPTRALFAVSCALLAAGSFLFHASVTREMQWLDMAGTYAALVAVVARGAVQAFDWPELPVVAAALAADAGFALFKWRIDAHVALPLLLLLASIPIAARVRAGRLSVRLALAPLGLFALAFALRQADVARVLCFPDSLLYQGHALWHVATAASLGVAFACLGERAAEKR
ncbi:MAG: hypothetical protein DCC71_20215 [Proteobacteria bacterium]|nr:MAG: hypothetical protein DCC71_20215 [Pseudomonadota bacterium]